jgi:hypothetical protein
MYLTGCFEKEYLDVHLKMLCCRDHVFWGFTKAALMGLSNKYIALG